MARRTVVALCLAGALLAGAVTVTWERIVLLITTRSVAYTLNDASQVRARILRFRPAGEHVFHGHYQCSFVNGVVLRCGYRDGKLHGRWQERRGDVLLTDATFSAGELVGAARWTCGGERIEGYFVEGLPHGEFRTLSPTGRPLAHTEFSKGEASAPLTLYDEHGEIVEQRLLGPWISVSDHYLDERFRQLGQAWRRSPPWVLPNRYSGQYEREWPDGTLAIRGHYLHGMGEGRWRSWNREGVLVDDLVFRDGIRDSGSTRELDRTGQVWLIRVYENGYLHNFVRRRVDPYGSTLESKLLPPLAEGPPASR